MCGLSYGLFDLTERLPNFLCSKLWMEAIPILLLFEAKQWPDLFSSVIFLAARQYSTY